MPVLNPSSVFVVDNGGGSLKAGFSNQSSPRIIPNCITKAKSEKRRAFVGDQIDDCRDLSSLFFMLPFQKGYLVNWDHQKTVWDYTFGKTCFNLFNRFQDLNFIMTEPYFNFSSVREGLSEILFEEYRFSSILRTNPGDLSCYNNKQEFPNEECCLVVDSGYSFTHIIPYIHGRRLKDAVVRIDVGGKLLTNHLKEIVSYRQIHVLDETYVMNAAKEDSCYVSLDFENDMRLARDESKKRRKENYGYKIAREYVLPDFTSLRRGYLREMKPLTAPTSSSTQHQSSEQTIVLNNERFSVPEVLFNPSDVGIMQMGIAEAIAHSISLCDESTHSWLYRNIVLTGGNVVFPNMKERVEREVRAYAPTEYDVIVRIPNEPMSYAWHGGALFADDPCLAKVSVSREEYLERGNTVCEERYHL
jgi:actin-related protein 6